MRFTAKTIALAVASAFVAFGCGKEAPKQQAAAPQAPAAPPAPMVVKIGHVGPLTGGIAHLGKDNENGALLAIEEANAAGITLGGQKVTFELVREDDQADPKIGNNVFRVVGRDDQQGPAVADYLAGQFKPKTAAVIDDATPYGEGLANEVEKKLKAAGVTVLPREKGTDKTIDWKAVLTKIKGKKPDVVFYGGMDATGGPLLKQARELKIGATFSFGDGGCTDKMAELAGAAAEGMVCSQAGIPVQAAGKKFLDGYKAAFKIDPILYAPFTYDATHLLIAAMKKADSAEPAKYLPALATISHDGASGNIQFDEKGDRKDAEMTIFTMKEGKITPIAIIKGGKSMTVDEYTAAGAASQPAAQQAAQPAAMGGMESAPTEKK
jgi:branched-chain amino acid transport system substrate-binding protein